jgi:hypothetical protein
MMMARLKLLELRCFETEDSGKDEAYLMVAGSKVWSTDGIKSGQTVSLRAVAPVPFEGTVEVSLWDEDTGLFDSDDNLGKFHVSDESIGEDEQEYRFNQDGADYLLIYTVLANRGGWAA